MLGISKIPYDYPYDVLAKLDDYATTNRTLKWYQPYGEQAGGQKEISCMGHIMTLRLIWFLFAKDEKAMCGVHRLVKAYDCVPSRRFYISVEAMGDDL